MRAEYWPRAADGQLKRALQHAGVVLIEGPNGCGKATTAAQTARSYLHLRYPWHRGGDPGPSDLAAIRLGPAPRMFSGAEAVSGLTAAAAQAAGSRTGEFILTKSVRSGPVGAGVCRLRMRPMSFFESGESSGDVSLADLFEGGPLPEAPAELTAAEAAFAMVRGGWPGMLGLEEPAALRGAGEQLGTLVGLKLGRLGGPWRDAGHIGAMMRALSRCLVTCASLDAIRASAAEDEFPVSEQTAAQCLAVLDAAFLTEDVPAWHPPLRTRTVLRVQPKRQLADPSLACAVMGLSPADLLSDVLWFTRLFKCACLRDLRVYAGCLDGEVLHYRDASGLKADAVVMLPDGRWAACEMALDVLGSEPAAARLLKLRDKVDTGELGLPSFLAVLTLSGEAHVRKDGVMVIPISVLKY